MLQAIESTRCEVVGFWDSDLATPLPAVPQLAAVIESKPHVHMVVGARVALLGRRISRSPIRHYLGRVFATLASLALELPIYDTQCGAKLFRVTPSLHTVLATPFLTRWVFDCEMIARFAALLPLPPADDRGAATRRGREPRSARATTQPAMQSLHEAIYEFPLEEWVDVAGSKVRAKASRPRPRALPLALSHHLTGASR